MQKMNFLRSKILYGLAVGLLLWLAGMIIFGQNGYLDYRALENKKQRLVSENRAAAETNRDLRRKVVRLKNDSDYIEYVARKELGMVDRDALIYRFRKGDNVGHE